MDRDSGAIVSDERMEELAGYFHLPLHIALPGQIRRRGDHQPPEWHLWAWVLQQAIGDLHSPNAKLRTAASAWLSSPDFDLICEWLDLNPTAVRKAALRPSRYVPRP